VEAFEDSVLQEFERVCLIVIAAADVASHVVVPHRTQQPYRTRTVPSHNHSRSSQDRSTRFPGDTLLGVPQELFPAC